MTRDQIELLCRNIQASTGDWKPEESILLKHDAEQRRVIEQQAQQITKFREALEGMLFIFGHHEGYAQVKEAQQALKEHQS